ncbi:MAG: hypothetical protein KDK25_01525 [Leptospiraceae bacterium]|nr:hypothetical protein [Leptospiraceae bacterium]
MEPWIVYSATNWTALFALVFVLSVLGIGGAGWFAYAHRNRHALLFALLALGPLALFSALDWNETINGQTKFADSHLDMAGDSLSFRTDGIHTRWQAQPAYYSIRRQQSSDDRTGKVTIVLQDLFGPSFEIQSLAVGEEAFPEELQTALLRLPGIEGNGLPKKEPGLGENEKADVSRNFQGQGEGQGDGRKADAYPRMFPSLPVIDEVGLLLDAGEGRIIRTAENSFSLARQKAGAPAAPLSLREIVHRVAGPSGHTNARPFPSAGSFHIGNEMRLEYDSDSPSFSRYGFSWLLFCLLGLFFYLLLLDAKPGLLGAINSAGLWLCIGTLALLIYTLPDPGSKSFQLVADHKEISLQTREENKRWNFEKVAYVRCEIPGSGIILYRENPEEILWEETSRHFVVGDNPMARGPDYLQLMESAFNSSAAALRMMQNSFTIPGGRLSPVEQVQLCSILGRLATRAKPQW